MLPILTDFLNVLVNLHADLNRTIEGLPREALDWSPGDDANSLAVLASHVAGSERYWIGEVAGGERAGRDRIEARADEFRAEGLEVTDLIARLDAALEHSRVTLDGLTPADLERTVWVDVQGGTYTALWPLAHALEHAATHLGHMQLTRQLWDQRAEG